MTSHVLSFPLGRVWRSIVAASAAVMAWVFWPEPQVAARRFKNRPENLSLSVNAFLLIWAVCGWGGDTAAAQFAWAVLWFAAVWGWLVVPRTNWHKRRCADYQSTCIEDETGDFALSREERKAVYDALRLNRHILRLTAQRDKILAPVADNIIADIHAASDHKQVGFLANLGNLVFPTGCVWRLHTQQAAGIARSRLHGEAARAAHESDVTKT